MICDYDYLTVLKKLLFFFLIYFTIRAPNAFGQNPHTIIFENVNVITMTEELVLLEQRVTVANGKILKIEPASISPQYHGDLIIDGRGKYLIPGLAEMHYHFRSNDITSDLKLLIANGITTVRNMAEFEGQDQIEIRDKIASGKLLGPNYFTTGPYFSSGDLQTEEQVSSVVRSHRDRGYDFLKIADNLPKNIYLKLLEEGQKYGVPIVGHAQRNLPLEYSLRMRSIEHLEEFIYLPSDDPATTLFKLATPDLNGIAQQVKSSDVYIGTTLTVFDFINQCLDDWKFSSLQKHDLVKFLAREQRENFLTEKNDYRKIRNLEFEGVNAIILFAQYFEWIKSFAAILSDHGVRLLTGSDTYGMVIVGFSLHQEFEFLQQAGLKPYDILRASTVHPARYLNTYSTEGTISQGKNANLVLLAKNPLEDIKNTAVIQGVMVKGEWFDRVQIDKMLEEVAAAFR